MADAWKEAEKAAQRGVAAAQDDATRVAANATKRFGDLSKRGQEFAREADQRIEEYTGRSSDAWIKEGSRFIIDLCINNRHSGHRKAGSSEPAMNERIRSGRLVTRLVIRQRVAMSSSTESGWPLASCALKCAHTHSSGLSSGA